MAIVRWGLHGPSGVSTPQRWFPATDVIEAEDGFVLRFDLPGVKQEDVAIELEDGVLSVAGERKHDGDVTGSGYRRLERPFGRFARALKLPAGIDADAVSASFSDGVLDIRVPKPAALKPRRIEIGGEHRGEVIEDGAPA